MMFRRRLGVFAALMCVLIFTLSACVVTLPVVQNNQETLFQTSTLSSLNAGNFDGEMTMAELKRHGDFGLGTFNSLDGEMVVVDGLIYQARDDGIAYRADDTVQTPFAVVTFFASDQTFSVNEVVDCPQLQTEIDGALPALDAPYAVKVSGEFSYLKVRAPHKESKPYPTLADALVDQVLFESRNISGTLVGFRLPEYLAGANAAGYHFHFISDDRLAGGHVLECEANALTIEIDAINEVYMDLSMNAVE
jgi:acetolactate decarboxylase